jgi:predicted RNA-binding Zn ribbon-like protein
MAGRRGAVADEPAEAALVLAFVNTLYPRPVATRQDGLASFEALVAWGRTAHLLSAAAADRLVAEGRRHPQQAAAAAARARGLREAIHGVATAVERGRSPAAGDLQTLATWLADACAHGRLALHEGRLHWVATDEVALDAVGWEVARAAGRLVTSDRIRRVRTCAADDCGWLFLDDTRNRSRRWCDMKTCGNRAKLRRFRAREV